MEFTKPERSIVEKTRCPLETEARSVKAAELRERCSQVLLSKIRGGRMHLENFPVNQHKLAEFLSKINDLKRVCPWLLVKGPMSASKSPKKTIS